MEIRRNAVGPTTAWTRRAALTIAFAVLASFGQVASASPSSLVQNGGFETPDAGGDVITFFAGESFGWTVEVNSVDVVGVWSVPEGRQALDLAGFEGGGTIAQTIPTTIGRTYALTFQLGANAGCGPGIWEMEVLWGNQSLGTFSAETVSEGDLGWEPVHRLVTAEAASTDLRFVSLTGGSCGVTLDAVALTRARRG